MEGQTSETTPCSEGDEANWTSAKDRTASGIFCDVMSYVCVVYSYEGWIFIRKGERQAASGSSN